MRIPQLVLPRGLEPRFDDYKSPILTFKLQEDNRAARDNPGPFGCLLENACKEERFDYQALIFNLERNVVVDNINLFEILPLRCFVGIRFVGFASLESFRCVVAVFFFRGLRFDEIQTVGDDFRGSHFDAVLVGVFALGDSSGDGDKVAFAEVFHGEIGLIAEDGYLNEDGALLAVGILSLVIGDSERSDGSSFCGLSEFGIGH